MMHMTFYWGKNVTLLFDAWSVSSWLGYILTLVAVFVFSVLHEWLSSQRAAFSSRPVSKGGHPHTPEHEHHAPLRGEVPDRQVDQGKKVLEALLFAVNVGTGYLLMLAVMSYNGGIFLAAVLGLAVGYYLFRDRIDSSAFPDPCCAAA